jgi:hypothetical protein
MRKIFLLLLLLSSLLGCTKSPSIWFVGVIVHYEDSIPVSVDIHLQDSDTSFSASDPYGISFSLPIHFPYSEIDSIQYSKELLTFIDYIEKNVGINSGTYLRNFTDKNTGQKILQTDALWHVIASAFMKSGYVVNSKHDEQMDWSKVAHLQDGIDNSKVTTLFFSKVD